MADPRVDRHERGNPRGLGRRTSDDWCRSHVEAGVGEAVVGVAAAGGWPSAITSSSALKVAASSAPVGLLRRSGSQCRVLIDGRPVRTGSLPGAWLHRRRLVKYAADIVVVRLNQAQDAPIRVLDPTNPADVELTGDSSIAGVSAERGGHHVRLTLAPAVPDLSRLESEVDVDGEWDLAIDDMSIGGTWWGRRRDQRVDLMMDVTRGWQPTGLPPLMRLMTGLVRMFRTWPTSYRWTAAITLDPVPRMSSRWERKGARRDGSYRRLTRSTAGR
jgi:hypothetical protein